METPLFFCSDLTTGKHVGNGILRTIRGGLAEACLTRWAAEEVNPFVLRPLPVDKDPFQLTRRKVAEFDSQCLGASYYILADDDCLPITQEPIVPAGIALMEKYPEFAILSCWPHCEDGPLLTCDNFWDGPRIVNDEIEEVNSAGGIRFCRTGCIKEWPEPTSPYQYDTQHCEALREAGYRVGYMKDIKFNHLGSGYSLSWP